MTLKKKFITLGVVTAILIIIYFVGAHFLNKLVDKEKKSSSNMDTAVDLTGNEYENLSNVVAKGIIEQNYDSIYKKFSWDLKKQLPEETFKINCESMLNSTGNFKEVADIIITENEDSVTSKIFIKYSQKGVCVNLFVDIYGKIDGITLDYCTVPTETEKYTEHYVSIGKYSLHGLLTVPNNIKNPPVVILVQDKGPLDMNSTVYLARPFLNLAHGLAKRGVAVLRFNKRYNQYSKLIYNEYSIHEEMLDDVESAIQLLKKDNRIDKNNIFILGHGLGGTMAPYIAKNNDITGVVSLASSPRHLAQVMGDQKICDIGVSNKSDNDKLNDINSIHSDVNKIKKLKNGGNELIFGLSKTFWYSFNKIYDSEEVKDLEVPMLFVQGSEDAEVYDDIDFAKWQDILEKKEQCTFIHYDDLNHYFIRTKDKNNSNNSYKIKGNVDKKVIKDIAKWVKSNSKSETKK
jgi:dienelactone hydrolase